MGIIGRQLFSERVNNNSSSLRERHFVSNLPTLAYLIWFTNKHLFTHIIYIYRIYVYIKCVSNILLDVAVSSTYIYIVCVVFRQVRVFVAANIQPPLRSCRVIIKNDVMLPINLAQLIWLNCGNKPLTTWI